MHDSATTDGTLEFDFYTIDEVAERFKCSPRTVHRWIEAGELAAFKKGGILRVSEKAIRAMVEGREET